MVMRGSRHQIPVWIECCTDHRIGMTMHQLTDVIDGKLQPFIDALTTHYQTERLKGDADGASAAD